MDELGAVLKKYNDENYIETRLISATDINPFALTFFKDVAELYDALTRVLDRDQAGVELKDAPILGLLVRIWKLLKEIIRYYEADNAEIISILDRPLLEAAVVASYLMMNDSAVMEDYRKCSYKDRLRILRRLENGSPFFDTKPGKRLVKSIREKMTIEQLSTADFEVQKRNKWRIQGKTFRDIFEMVIDNAADNDLYSCSYGMMSESIHGSWNESLDYCLIRNDDGTYKAFPHYQPAEIRYVCPTIYFANKPFRLWLNRRDMEREFGEILDWIDRVNNQLYRRYDESFDK